jgi:hypothetical protein
MPYPLELVLFMREFDAEVRAPYVPVSLVRVATAPLACIARRRGLGSRYQKLMQRAPQSRRIRGASHTLPRALVQRDARLGNPDDARFHCCGCGWPLGAFKLAHSRASVGE